MDHHPGEECLLVAVAEVKEALKDLEAQRSVTPSCNDQVRVPGAFGPVGEEEEEEEEDRLAVVIWFHHIKSLTKRKLIVSWARELDLRGYCKPGFPGLILCEGSEGAVEEYLERLRSLKWQAMQVRGEDRQPVTCMPGEHPAVGIKERWRFREIFRELSEHGLSELAAHCRTAGLDSLFRAGMKID